MATASDVVYQDDDICILRPNSKCGVFVYYAGFRENICDDGLLSWNEARKRFPDIPARPDYKDYNDIIKFRAPFTSNLKTFKSSFKVEPRELLGPNRNEVLVVLRIDPNKSYVYSSEARTHKDDKALHESRIPFNEYIKRIANRENIKPTKQTEICSNIVSYETKLVSSAEPCTYPWIKYLPIERNAEIVAKLPMIPPAWFVSCIRKKGRSNNKTLKVRRQRNK